MNVVKTLSKLPDIEELNVDLETKRIKIKFNDENISKEVIEFIVNESITNGMVNNLELLLHSKIPTKNGEGTLN